MSELNIDLRTIAAILVKPDGDLYSHQQISNRYKPDDKKQLVFTDVTNIIRKEEDELLRCIALRNKRAQYVYDYIVRHGTKPSIDEIKKITLQNEVNNEKFETV